MNIKTKIAYQLITFASTVGLIAAFIQTVEKFTLLKNPSADLVCNINPFFNCSNILDAWQSSVFGFPNTLMCIVFFSATLSISIAGLTGAKLGRIIRLAFQGMALFFVGFGLWYILESILVIGTLCIFCIACYISVLIISGVWLRLNQSDINLGDLLNKTIAKSINNKYDIVFWITIGLLIIAAAIIKFS